jgi:hypothetical protein
MTLQAKNKIHNNGGNRFNTFVLDHITIRIDVVNRTFGLFPGNPEDGAKALFTGFIEPGMGTTLRRLAHTFDELERK